MKPMLRKLAARFMETWTAFADVFAKPARTLTPAQHAKLAEMEKDYADLIRQRRAGGR